ncbi:sce7726 family protein [Acinetobacter bereziniae]|uniref:sce7726 family protein n=1 Tax=Acinetobacter bereziniae TaxID=106648 RepID=UPI002575AE65|nr:sce7726 family protein [Acinetobacter bereziniae]MDM1783140.1 sce7726 family protein [Acinetobacter bereziniae]
MTYEFAEIARAFNKNTFEEILEGDFSYVQKIHKKYFDDQIKTIGQFYEISYQLLLKKHKNEYVFKNSIAQKIVIGKHKLSNVSLFNEFKVWNKYVDIVIVNGCTTAYEIKTEFDSYARLNQQLSVYIQVFEFVNLVVPESKFKENLVNTIPTNVGILVLTKRNALLEKRRALSNLENLSQEMIFSCLRRQEYEDFVVSQFGCLPNVKPVYMRSYCLELFKISSKNELNLYFKEVLKKRKSLMRYKKFLIEAPKSLNNIVLNENLKTVEKIIKIANTELY